MKALEELMNQQKLFVKVESPEVHKVEDQWWFIQQGHRSNDEITIMAPADYYIRWKNGEDLTVKYESLEEAIKDFTKLGGDMDEDFRYEYSDSDDEGIELLEDAFENKSGFRRPELITYF